MAADVGSAKILHGSARTTASIRRTIQHSQASLSELSQRFDLNPKTVAKWKKRKDVQDAQMGPKQPCSTVLTLEEEATIVAFRKHTLLPLDDCLYALQASIPQLTRSSLHRCFVRHSISRLPTLAGKKATKKAFKYYPLGYFHIDIAEVRTEEGKLHLFVAIDRTSKVAYAELHPRATKVIAAQFPRNLVGLIPYKLHTVLTDNGIGFTNRKKDRLAFTHIFDRVCLQHDIEHRLTKSNHPWTNGQVERMNRTLKEATVKRYHYQTHQQLETLRGLAPYEFVCASWQKEPSRFRLDPHHHTLGLCT